MRLIVITGSIVVGLAVSAPHASAQSCATAGPFCIDGIITDANNSGVPTAEKDVDPNASARELGPINGSPTKIGVIHTAPKPMLGTTNPNAQVDLNAIWTQTAQALNGDQWYYFAWSRDSNSGSGFISIELQQNPLPAACDYQTQTQAQLIANCNPWAGRQAGDFILLWDQQGGSRDVYKRVFSLQNGVLVLGPAVALGSAKAEFSLDGFRGEAAINLTQDVFPSDGSCQTFANTIPGTVTGNSDTADYKDTVLSFFEPVANCGSLVVTKHVSPTTATGNFEYTVARGGNLLRFLSDAEEHPADGAHPQTSITRTLTSHGASGTHLDLIPASNYTLVEADPGPQFTMQSITCTVNGSNTPVNLTNGGTFAIEVGKVTRCTIVNALAVAELKIIKTVVNDFGLTAQPGDFKFSRDQGTAEPFANNGTSCTSGAVCKTISYPIGATFSVVETDLPANYTMTSAVGCSGTIVQGGNTCTITNTAQPAQPLIATVQRVVLHDQAVVSGVRRTSGDSLSVTFVLYGSLANCQAQGANLGSETRPVVFASTSATSGTASTQTGVSVEQASNTAVLTYFWRVHSAGNTANAGFVSECGAEQTNVQFIYGSPSN